MRNQSLACSLTLLTAAFAWALRSTDFTCRCFPKLTMELQSKFFFQKKQRTLSSINTEKNSSQKLCSQATSLFWTIASSNNKWKFRMTLTQFLFEMILQTTARYARNLHAAKQGQSVIKLVQSTGYSVKKSEIRFKFPAWRHFILNRIYTISWKKRRLMCSSAKSA